MRFNNNLLLIASFLGVATALRRGCRVDNSGAAGTSGTGFYTFTANDRLDAVAADFCSNEGNLRNLNPGVSFSAGTFIRVPCKVRQRDCAKIPNSSNGYYKIVSGDQLRFIADDFCTSTTVLQNMNSDVIKNINAIFPDDILQVPCAWN
ncbi:uncharacterized protein L3040_000783 [Drepanopeziza brunnea f. sp. 'multigermtubi']|uniref:uncharacterized protein n=1 Tax=Drepanopeziza brunnea f. sp. 'multigermtubi' TaxID=698441 RepID=UPI0023961B2E|nr:hypothetical protein L3040_000783 [Drepanopeziza brunnea f. sp. 'multigermtubi']